MRTRPLSLLVLTSMPPLLSGQSPKQTEDTLRLRDFQPKSMLHVAEHQVLRARFPVIDVHNHLNDAHSTARQDPAKVVQMMDRINVKKIVILTGGFGDGLERVLQEMVKPYPDRFVVFTQVDWSRLNEPNFGELMAQQIRDNVKRGARGLKILKELGLTVRDSSGKLVTVDDPRLDPIWSECGKLGIPVAIHVSDPEAFFHPIDRFNERYIELIRYPDWSFCCPPKFPRLEEILAARDRMIAKHPKTTFIVLHMGWAENLDNAQQMLDRFPNTVVEFGARQAELGRQPRRTREFFLKNPDRILFGTDHGASAEMYQNYFRWLETADEYFQPWVYPWQGLWNIYGLDLPDDVLAGIYSRNAERVLGAFRGHL